MADDWFFGGRAQQRQRNFPVGTGLNSPNGPVVYDHLAVDAKKLRRVEQDMPAAI